MGGGALTRRWTEIAETRNINTKTRPSGMHTMHFQAGAATSRKPLVYLAPLTCLCEA